MIMMGILLLGVFAVQIGIRNRVVHHKDWEGGVPWDQPHAIARFNEEQPLNPISTHHSAASSKPETRLNKRLTQS